MGWDKVYFGYRPGRISIVKLLGLWLSSCRPHTALTHTTRSSTWEIYGVRIHGFHIESYRGMG